MATNWGNRSQKFHKGKSMEITFVPAPSDAPLDRMYIIAATLNTFKGRKHVDVQIFRAETDDAELERLQKLDIVSAPDPSVPPQVLQGATRDAALRYVLEAFTEEESRSLAAYLENRYAGHIEKLLVCPLDLPVPLGVGPLAGIGKGKTTGIIRFEAVPDYPLPFAVHGFYDLAAHDPLSAE